MVVRIITYKGYEMFKSDYIEFRLGGVIVALEGLHSSTFCLCSPESYLTIKFYPENEDERKVMENFSWQDKDNISDSYIIYTGCNMVFGAYDTSIPEACINEVCDRIFKDQLEFRLGMKDLGYKYDSEKEVFYKPEK